MSPSLTRIRCPCLRSCQDQLTRSPSQASAWSSDRGESGQVRSVKEARTGLHRLALSVCWSSTYLEWVKVGGQEAQQGLAITQHHMALPRLYTRTQHNPQTPQHSTACNVRARVPSLCCMVCTVCATEWTKSASTCIICPRSIASCPTATPHNHTPQPHISASSPALTCCDV